MAPSPRRHPASPRPTVPAHGGSDTELQARHRLRCISEAAYYRALARGFAPGGDLQDWLAAEAEFDAEPSVHPHRPASTGD